MFNAYNMKTGAPTPVSRFIPPEPSEEDVRFEAKQRLIERVDYVCHEHQTLASKCGCLDLHSHCERCGLELSTHPAWRGYCMICEM